MCAHDLQLPMATNYSMLTSLLENAPCSVCGSSNPKTIKAECYPNEVDADVLLRAYSSASEARLMDRLVKCKDCGMVFLSPRLRSDLILSSYADAPDENHWAQRDMRVGTFSKSLASIASRLGVLPSEDFRILDIGSAGGYFLKAAVDAGFSSVGVEPNKELSERGRQYYGVDLRSGTLDDQHFAPESFSLVTLWDVLEHVTEPRILLEQIKIVLKQGGRLAVNFPDYGSRIRKLMRFKWPFFLSVHLHYFTVAHLDRLLREVGYRTLYTTPHWQTLQCGYVLKRASSSAPVMSFAEKFANAVGVGRFPLSYYVGQTLLVAEKV